MLTRVSLSERVKAVKNEHMLRRYHCIEEKGVSISGNSLTLLQSSW